MPAIGKKAPAFVLAIREGDMVRLVDQHLKVSPEDSVARALEFLQGME